MIKIRKAKIEDCKACFEIAKETRELDSPLEETVPLWWFEELAKKSKLFFVAEEKEEIIGFRMGEQLIGDGAISHLLTVKKGHRDKGVGTLIVKAFEEECKKLKIRWIIIYAFENNPKTIQFFEKNGYAKGALTREFLKLL